MRARYWMICTRLTIRLCASRSPGLDSSQSVVCHSCQSTATDQRKAVALLVTRRASLCSCPRSRRRRRRKRSKRRRMPSTTRMCLRPSLSPSLVSASQPTLISCGPCSWSSFSSRYCFGQPSTTTMVASATRARTPCLSSMSRPCSVTWATLACNALLFPSTLAQ